jgi:hypothetical protein
VLKADQAKHGSAVPVGGAGGQSAEVALSVVRILASLAESKPVSGEAALGVLAQKGLEGFLNEFESTYCKQ